MSNNEAKEILIPDEVGNRKRQEYKKEYDRKHRAEKSEYNKNYYQEHKEHEREYDRQYHLKNREKENARKREAYRRNRDKQLARNRIYYQKNRERIIAKHREYYSDTEHKARLLEIKREWRRKHKERENERQRIYRKKLREEFKRFKIEYGGKCMFPGCEERNLDVLEPHHLEGKKERSSFIMSKEFRDWLKYDIKPKIVLICSNHHTIVHLQKTQEELAKSASS